MRRADNHAVNRQKISGGAKENKTKKLEIKNPKHQGSGVCGKAQKQGKTSGPTRLRRLDNSKIKKLKQIKNERNKS